MVRFHAPCRAGVCTVGRSEAGKDGQSAAAAPPERRTGAARDLAPPWPFRYLLGTIRVCRP